MDSGNSISFHTANIFFFLFFNMANKIRKDLSRL